MITSWFLPERINLVCNLPISENPLPFFESIITRQNYWSSCVVINSFSKADSVAGLRIGYIYGEESLITACSALNANTIMNPPTFPAFAIVLTCLFRCIYLSEYFGAVSLKEKLKKLNRWWIQLLRLVYFLRLAILFNIALRCTDWKISWVKRGLTLINTTIDENVLIKSAQLLGTPCLCYEQH